MFIICGVLLSVMTKLTSAQETTIIISDEDVDMFEDEEKIDLR